MYGVFSHFSAGFNYNSVKAFDRSISNVGRVIENFPRSKELNGQRK